jgi:signal peptidase I
MLQAMSQEVSSDGTSSGRPAATRVGRAVATLVIPALAAMALLRVAIPSRLEGARGGFLGVLSILGDEQALLVFIALFLVLSEVGRYWYRRARVEAPAAPRSRRRGARVFAVVAAMALVAFFVRGSVAGVVRVIGPSMQPTFELGDRVLVDRLAYGFAWPLSKTKVRTAAKPPRRGDLVVFSANVTGPTAGPQRLVKRVIGVEGDRIDVSNGLLRINSQPIPFCDAGPYVVMVGKYSVRGRLGVEFLGDAAYLTIRKPVEPDMEPYTVKPGEVFVAGDDRGLSSDSRQWADSFGGVPISALEGRVSRVLVGSLPDGRLDLSRLLARPLSLEVRQPNLDLTETRKRIDSCLAERPAASVAVR